MVNLKWSRRKKIAVSITAIVMLALFIFIVWAETPLGPMPDALLALQSDSKVRVSIDHWITFEPLAEAKTVGFIFYPGGRVDPRSYAPMCHSLAEMGYTSFIVPMPLNLAVFGVESASNVISSFPQIQLWVIGGHSLGGSMAASYAYNHPTTIKGLVLFASYPASSINMTMQKLLVSSIYGTRDGLVNSNNLNESRSLLPADTIWVPIEGGNHAQMGWYGSQPGDNEATISRENQQQQITAATINLLELVEIN